jgi:hypothetical protein
MFRLNSKYSVVELQGTQIRVAIEFQQDYPRQLDYFLRTILQNKNKADVPEQEVQGFVKKLKDKIKELEYAYDVSIENAQSIQLEFSFMLEEIEKFVEEHIQGEILFPEQEQEFMNSLKQELPQQEPDKPYSDIGEEEVYPDTEAVLEQAQR